MVHEPASFFKPFAVSDVLCLESRSECVVNAGATKV